MQGSATRTRERRLSTCRFDSCSSGVDVWPYGCLCWADFARRSTRRVAVGLWFRGAVPLSVIHWRGSANRESSECHKSGSTPLVSPVGFPASCFALWGKLLLPSRTPKPCTLNALAASSSTAPTFASVQVSEPARP